MNGVILLFIFSLIGCATSSEKKLVEDPIVVSNAKPQEVEFYPTQFRINAKDFLNLNVGLLPIETVIANFEIKGWRLSHALFGYLTGDEANPKFVLSTEVPYRVGRLYGWALYFEEVFLGEGERPLTLIERLILPKKPSLFGVDKNSTTLDRAKRTATTKLKIDPKERWIFNFWQTTKEDPVGKYSIEIMIHGKRAVNFDFSLVTKLSQPQPEVEIEGK